jgi:hypothetical protein
MSLANTTATSMLYTWHHENKQKDLKFESLKNWNSIKDLTNFRKDSWTKEIMKKSWILDIYSKKRYSRGALLPLESISGISRVVQTSHCFDVLKLYFLLGLAHSRIRNENIVIKMQIWRYRLENYSLNAFDSDSSKTIRKKIRPKGPKLCSAKGMAIVYIIRFR